MKRVGPPSNEVKTCDELKAKVDNTKLALVYFGDLSAKEFSSVFIPLAENPSISEKYQFFHIADAECATANGVTQTPALVFFRKFEESPLVYTGAIEVDPVLLWLQGVSVPTLIEFSEDYIEPIFGQRKQTIFLFRSKEDADSTFAKTFAEAAKALKGEVLFVVSGVTDGIQGRLGEFVGVDESALPTIRLLDPQENMKKFSFPTSIKDITVEGLKTFISDFKANKLEAFLKSQEIPEDDGKALKTLVGKNFKDQVINTENEVFVKFYAPWCGHCKSMAPAWEQLADELKDVSGLFIADFDATANEVDGVDIRGFPTLKLYKGGQPVDYDGGRDLESFKTFLKENSVTYKKYLDSRERGAEF